MRFPLRTSKGYGVLISTMFNSRDDSTHPYAAILRCICGAETKKEFVLRCSSQYGLKTTYRKAVSRLFPTIFAKEQGKFSELERLDNYAALYRQVASDTLANKPRSVRSILVNSIDYTPTEYSDSRHLCGPIDSDLIEDVERDKKLRRIARELVRSSLVPKPWKARIAVANKLTDKDRLAVSLVLAMRDVMISSAHWFPLLVDLPYNCRIGWAIAQLYPECRLTFASSFKIFCWNNFPSLIESVDISNIYACSVLSWQLPVCEDRQFVRDFRRTIANSVLCRHRRLLIERAISLELFETAGRLAFHFIDILSKGTIRLLSECPQTKPIGELASKISEWSGDRGMLPLESAPIGLLSPKEQTNENHRQTRGSERCQP